MKKIICTMLVLAFCTGVFSAVKVADKKHKQSCGIETKETGSRFTMLSLLPHLNAE